MALELAEMEWKAKISGEVRKSNFVETAKVKTDALEEWYIKHFEKTSDCDENNKCQESDEKE